MRKTKKGEEKNEFNLGRGDSNEDVDDGFDMDNEPFEKSMDMESEDEAIYNEKQEKGKKKMKAFFHNNLRYICIIHFLNGFSYLPESMMLEIG